jgi:hypothetical protein
VVSCAAFSAASDQGAAAGDAAPDDALASADGSADGGGDPGQCFALTQGTFTPSSSPNATVSAAGIGLLVGYPLGPVAAGTLTAPLPAPFPAAGLDGGVVDLDGGGGGVVDGSVPDASVADAGGGDGGGGGAATGSVAMWTTTFQANGAHAATVTIDAAIDLQSVPLMTPWYAGFAGLVNGSLTPTASFVQLALANVAGASQMGMDVNTFPGGTAAAATPSTSNNFGGLALQVGAAIPHGVKVVFDVAWSETAAQTTVTAQLDKQAPVQVSAATLKGTLASSWTLVLGGSAVGNPALNIRYGRACVALRP